MTPQYPAPLHADKIEEARIEAYTAHNFFSGLVSCPRPGPPD